ncbi:MAG: hypothetical protein ACFBZ8_13890 [Opitutales bacterium]
MDLPVTSGRRTKKKPIYSIGDGLRTYLRKFGREEALPLTYDQMCDFMGSAPLIDSKGEDTLWETVVYNREQMPEISRKLTQIYAILKAEGETSVMDHLYCDRVDYCTFGNTHPFRVRIVNARNDNQDYYYIKRADASRVYGLELEHLLSPNRMHYLTCGETLIEEHVVGIPGDMFISRYLGDPPVKNIRLAKELVKFNERCFIRLLGDMRSYNFVFVLTPDFEETQVRIRAMDFDQQSYSGRKNFYMPQYFKENNPFVFFCVNEIEKETAFQYQREEQALIHRRRQSVRHRVNRLLNFMCQDRVAPPEKVMQLRAEMAAHYGNPKFLDCDCMGKILWESLETISRNLHKQPENVPGPSILKRPTAADIDAAELE